MSTQSFNNLNVSNTINSTNLNCNNVNADNMEVEILSIGKLNLTDGINNNITLSNLNSLDTTSSITSQFIDAKNYTDSKYNLLLNNPDVNINSIQELFNILGNDPSLNVVNSLGDKISKTQANQTISALNMNFTNPIIASDFTIKNTDNSTKSVKNSLSTNETSITNLTTNLSNNYYTKTQVDTSINNTNTNLTNNYYTKTQSDTNYYTKTQSDTNYYTKASIDNNFFTKTFMNQAYYNVIQIDSKIDPINEKLSTNDTGLTVNSNNITFLKPIVSSYPISTTSSLSSNSLTTTGTLTTTRISSTNVNNSLEINLGLGPNAVTCVNGRFGINLSNPVAGSVLHVYGGSTLEGSLHVTEPADFDSSINCESLTIGAVNVGDTLTNNIALINQLQTQITSLQSQINSLIKIRTRLRAVYSVNQYVVISSFNISSIAKIANGICGIILTQKSNTIGAWTPYTSITGGTRNNIVTGITAGYPSYDYVIIMSDDYGFSFMLVEQ